METEIQIIHASYTIEDQQAVIELYGRCRDGHSVVVRYHGFRPYCYFKHNEVSTRKILNDYAKLITAHEFVELEHMLMKEKYAKIYTDLPATVAKIRKKYEKETPFMSADIRFPLRFLYDLDLGHYVKVVGKEISTGTYTTDKVIEAIEITNIESFQQQPTILSFDIETSLTENVILTICVHTEYHDGKVETYKIIGDEKDIIKQFINIVTEADPDILTGYNIMFYDLPKIEERAKVHRVPVRICRNGSAMWSKSENNRKYYEIPGRIIADAWLHTKLIKKPKRETLNYVSKEYLGEEKLDVNPKAIDDEWEADKTKVLEYCLKDAELALRLLKYIKIVDKNISMATVAKLPLSVAFKNQISPLADSLSIRMADINGVAVPCTHKTTGEEKIKGAYVKEPKPGLYQWVIVLDFRAMYPSIIINNNLCSTTYAPEIGDIETPVGARFLSPEIREGMAPKIMTKLMNDRAVIKDDLKKAKANKEDQNIIDYLDDLQYSVKVLANSFYGLFTSGFYRFTNRAIGESITAYAREAIKRVIEQLEKEGITVVASDTDSVFLLSPYEDLEKSKEFGEELSKRFSQEGFELEFEKLMDRWFTHGAKKRYYGHVVWPDDEFYIRGYEMRRRDSFDILTDTLEEIFQLIMKDDTDAAVKIARQIILDIKAGKAPIEKLVISKSTRPENEYVNPDSLPQVRCARKLKLLGHAIAPYMSVAWIVTNSRKTPMVIEPYIAGDPFEKTPDWEYYANRLSTAFGRVTEVFGWDENRLYTGTHQKDLFSYEN